MKSTVLFIGCFFVLFTCSFANNLQISNVNKGSDANGKVLINFDISWENSWRCDIVGNGYAEPYNYDAVWLFVKYRPAGGEWKHATLSTDVNDQAPISGSQITPYPNGKGILIYRNANGSGNLSLSNIGISWNYLADSVLPNNFEIKLIGIEMVYVPQGSFYLGDGGPSFLQFSDGNTNTPYLVNYQGTVTIGSNGLNYDGAFSGETNPNFPTGFNAFYCMKYELSQGQYVDFLNMLTPSQGNNRFPNAYGLSRHRIQISNNFYATDRPDRACNFLSWLDLLAYADWAGMRPMSELEFEKACRGPRTPILLEYAWGSTQINLATMFSGDENGTETIDGNCITHIGTLIEGDGEQGPIRCGIFARTGRTRLLSGATYYGIMEMTGNVWEQCISIDNIVGRFYDANHGDGNLTTQGNFNVSGWVSYNGGKLRGGGWFYPHMYNLSISGRTDATDATRNYERGGRVIISAP